jgi:Skp family chaperone for outer membrane proteins
MTRKLATATLAAGLLLASCKGPSTPAADGGKGGPKPPKANPVVVVLDMGRLMSESALFQSLQQELKTWAEGKQNDLRTRAQALQAQSAGMKPAEVEAARRQLLQEQEIAKQEFQRRQGEAADRMKKAFEPVIQSLAKENGWDVVLNKNEQLTIFVGEALDQTDFVLARFNATPTGAAAPAAPAPATK